MAQLEGKQLAAQRAADMVQPGMVVGLGSGSTATLFIRALGERVRAGLSMEGICSSSVSEALARELAIPLTDFDRDPVIHLAVDGADEIAPGLALIKGGGGFLLREKIVISASEHVVIVADSSKLVERLGAFPLPVEVIQMATPLVVPALRALGLEPRVRVGKDGGPYVTDEGNWILDCATGRIEDPRRLGSAIREIVGVVEHGLFVGMARTALVSDGRDVRELGIDAPESLFAAAAPAM